MKKRSQKRDNKGSIKGPTGDAILIPSEAFRSAKTDAEAAQRELDKNSKVVDTAHVRRLLRETLLPRRTWIEKEAKRILDVTTKYPQLAVHDLIVYEFTTWKNLKLEEIYQKVDVLLEKLASLFCLETVTEESKASIIERLNNELGNKRLAKTTTAPFIVKEVMGSTENLVTAQDESPRAVCYIAKQGIASAFIVADEAVRVKIPEPTVHKLVVALLASYYVWDTAYLTAYANVLQYLDHEILGMPIKNNNVVSKFIRKRDVALKTIANDNGDK